MEDFRTDVGKFAASHPFITAIIIADLCKTVVKLVRGYPDAPIRDLNISSDGVTGKWKKSEEPEAEVTDPEVKVSGKVDGSFVEVDVDPEDKQELINKSSEEA